MPFDGYVELGSESYCYYTFSGLEPDTGYYVKVSPRAATTAQEEMESPTTVLVYTDAKVVSRPKNWSWTSIVRQGEPMEYDATREGVFPKPLTAKEWNDFLDRIFLFLEYDGHEWSGNMSGFYVSTGEEMIAEEVDVARQLIEVMHPPTALPAAIESGDKITAAYINGLKNSLNSIP